MLFNRSTSLWVVIDLEFNQGFIRPSHGLWNYEPTKVG